MASQRPDTHLFLFFIHFLSLCRVQCPLTLCPPHSTPALFTGSIDSIGAIYSLGLHDREHIVALWLPALAASLRCIIAMLVQAL